ncbi:bifunctional hydroxymethylpyrimidine kinase/phosphomethylpyrimidine kinase [Priestia taiwanensis]|uniref:Hydroxymethylpyrimidine/phosphomethylpyrimidine kinase n=1 Tax=Priestia taiwanensis TaxID=1347902 RepID=A0A917AQU2_9BACI|nr:bifunctional hydroxymethylpyrimidine kinase/phosphomethylpyrimidine kinase [Priestia taiwanensis]MBM7363083.1 hydroxymethylpyrimidine/phosphomethylpyrimidine kinase [Priestia taiwanensis]GGE67565.1 hydroxymethylpyrimidine/phosphomethylpyrimidine kinase [Priestia taiwanensis]
MGVKKALTIAGSDCGGGAGIQADIKTFQELEVYGMSAITAITAQNTLGVQGVYPMSLEAIEEQLNSIGADLTPEALKTGMLFNSEIITLVARKINEFGWGRVVVDPVMIAKGGATLLQQEAVEALRTHLLPLAYVVTPNVPEAEVLAEMKIESLDDYKEAAERIRALGPTYVVMKGGHATYQGDTIIDYVYDGSEFVAFESKRVESIQTHGSGCTFAAALTAELAKGNSVNVAMRRVKQFIQSAIENELNIGSGHGPTNHFAHRLVHVK